ncbi:hypothetical protein ACLKMH_19710 [Psychromonas sp. KJ10-10]|uniref:hypothetical protein n=1 Tax=Psychromonas sp. KJ10-10 TaxID=3391823 RepID=UPI0039B42744
MKYWQKLVFVLLSLLASAVQAEHSLPMIEDKTTYQTQVIWSDVTIPWGMVQLANGQILATETFR